MTHPSCIPFPMAANSAVGHVGPIGNVTAFLDLRPLSNLSDAELEGFLYRSRMCPTRSRFMPGNAEWLAPRRDITVRVALETVRERMQQAAACAELVARLERDYMDEDTLSDDDEALIVAAAVRDNLREALGMLGVVEVGLERVAQGGRYDLSADLSAHTSAHLSENTVPLPRAEEPVAPYQVLALAA